MSGIDGRNPSDDFAALQKELDSYSEELAKKSFIIALNKIDTEEGKENLTSFKSRFPPEKYPLFEISALSGEGTDTLLETVKTLVQKR